MPKFVDDKLLKFMTCSNYEQKYICCNLLSNTDKVWQYKYYNNIHTAMLTLIDLKYGTEIFLRRDWSELSDAENFKVMTSFWLDY